jgi:hypothetical protein
VSPAGYPNRGANREKGTRVAEVGAHGDALVGALPERGLAQGSGTSRRPRRASRRLETVDGARANIVRLGAGEEPGDHQVRERAWLMVVEGAARIEAGGDVVDAEPGTLLTLEDCRQALTLRRLNFFYVPGLHGADCRRSRMVGLALLPEPRPKARNLPTRYGARDEGAQANRIRRAGPAFRWFERALSGG